MSRQQTESEVALWMVQREVPKLKQEWRYGWSRLQWAVHKLKQRWRYGWSSEQFTNWNRGGAIGWSKEQFLNWNRGGATDGLVVSSSQAETEVALRMVKVTIYRLEQRRSKGWMEWWAEHKLKQRWSSDLFKYPITQGNRNVKICKHFLLTCSYLGFWLWLERCGRSYSSSPITYKNHWPKGTMSCEMNPFF